MRRFSILSWDLESLCVRFSYHFVCIRDAALRRLRCIDGHSALMFNNLIWRTVFVSDF